MRQGDRPWPRVRSRPRGPRSFRLREIPGGHAVRDHLPTEGFKCEFRKTAGGFSSLTPLPRSRRDAWARAALGIPDAGFAAGAGLGRPSAPGSASHLRGDYETPQRKHWALVIDSCVKIWLIGWLIRSLFSNSC